ncbi:MAG: hypothetical protein V3V30_04005 [Parvularculaceae bacterium]
MKKVTLSVLACLGVALGSASAASVTVRDNPITGPSVYLDDALRATVTINTGTERTVGAGVFSLQMGSIDDGFRDFLTFCLQVNESLTLPLEHEITAGDSYFGLADREALGIAFGNMMTTQYALADGISSAAMQIIIWEIAEDGAANFDLTAGAFILLTDAVRDRANEFWVLIQSGTLPVHNFNVLVAAGTQDLLTLETPLPGAALLMGTGIAAFARRRKKTRA